MWLPLAVVQGALVRSYRLDLPMRADLWLDLQVPILPKLEQGVVQEQPVVEPVPVLRSQVSSVRTDTALVLCCEYDLCRHVCTSDTTTGSNL